MTDNRRFWRVLLLIVLAALALRVGYVLLAKRTSRRWATRSTTSPRPTRSPAATASPTPRDGSQTAEHPPLTALALTPTVVGRRSSSTRAATTSCAHAPHDDGLRRGVVLVIGLLGRAVAGNRAGLLAAGIAAVYPNLWMNDGLVMSETLATLAVALAILLTYRFIRSPRPSTAAWVGVAMRAGDAGARRARPAAPADGAAGRVDAEGVAVHAPAPPLPAHVRGRRSRW